MPVDQHGHHSNCLGPDDVSILVMPTCAASEGATPRRVQASSKMRGSGLCRPTSAEETMRRALAEPQAVHQAYEPRVPVGDEPQADAPALRR